MAASNITLHSIAGGLLLYLTVGSALAAESTSLAKLTISGVSGDLKTELEKHLPVNQPMCDASKAEVSDYFRSLKTSLRKGGRALGYYDAEFTSGGKQVDGCWEMTMNIEPGEPVRVVSQYIEVKGAGLNEPEFRKIMQAPPYRQGDVLNHQLYDDFKTQLTEAAETLGYLEAAYVAKQVNVDPLAYQARVNLILDTGPRFTFGDVTVHQDVVGDGLVNRYLKIRPGVPFSTETVIEQQQAFQRSGYYSKVAVDVGIKDAKNQQIPVTITLTRAKRDRYRYKVGYGTDTGPRVKAELLRRWTGDKGRKIEASAQWAQTLSEVKFELIEPRNNPDYDSLTYLIDWTYDTSDDLDSVSFEFGADYRRKLDSDWIQGVFINTLVDRTEADGGTEDNSIITFGGVRLSKTSTNDDDAATTGWNIHMQALGALDNVLSDQSLGQFEASGKYIFPVGKGRVINRMEVGATNAGDLEDLPKKLRYFAGGLDSVRGYDFESIGEENSSGSVIGGKNVFTASVEYEHPIKDAWSVAGFLDTGDAFNDWDDMDLKFGVGFGGRYRSPFGPVRVDIGFPTDDFSDPSLYLSVGPDL